MFADALPKLEILVEHGTKSEWHGLLEAVSRRVYNIIDRERNGNFTLRYM